MRGPLLGDGEVDLGPVDELPLLGELLDEGLEPGGGLVQDALMEILHGQAERGQGLLIFVLLRFLFAQMAAPLSLNTAILHHPGAIDKRDGSPTQDLGSGEKPPLVPHRGNRRAPLSRPGLLLPGVIRAAFIADIPCPAPAILGWREALVDVLPAFRVVEEVTHGLDVKGVAGLAGREMPADGDAEKEEVADEVEDLVADEFVREPERAVDELLVVQDERVREGAAEGQAAAMELGDVLEEAEGPGRGDLRTEGLRRHADVERLGPDGRMIEFDEIGDPQAVVGDGFDGGPALLDDEGGR